MFNVDVGIYCLKKLYMIRLFNYSQSVIKTDLMMCKN